MRWDERLIIIGGGGHARVVSDAALAAGFNVVGYVDLEEKSEMATLTYLGPDDAALDLIDSASFILGLGELGPASLRPRVVGRYREFGARWATVVHPTAWVSPTATLGEGAFVSGQVCINSRARIGQHALVNTASVVEHDVILGDYCSLGPRVAVGGGASIGARTFVGLGASLRDHITVGDDCSIAMGGVVVGDVAPGQAVVGVPARPSLR